MPCAQWWLYEPGFFLEILGWGLGGGDDVLEGGTFFRWICSFQLVDEGEEAAIHPGVHVGFAGAVVDEEPGIEAFSFDGIPEGGEVQGEDFDRFDCRAG